MKRPRTRCRLLAALGGMALLGGCAAGGAEIGQPHLVRHDGTGQGILIPVAALSRPSPEQLALVGMDANHVDDLFGPPQLALSAGDAQWWRYPLGACTLDVFMLHSSSTRNMIVSHVSVRPLQQTAMTERSSCQELDARLSQVNAGSNSLPAVHIY